MPTQITGPIVALDVGGTKIAAALLEEPAQLRHRRQCPTRAAEGAEAILGRMLGLTRELLQIAEGEGRPVTAVGVGTGGWVDPVDGHVVYATPLLPGWNGLPLRARLEEALSLPVAVGNDVHVTGLGEAVWGAGQPYRQLLCLAVGTGIGGAIILDKRILQGAAGAAGSLGHVSIDALRGRPCNCGGVGCIERYASGPAITADFIRRVGSAQLREWLGKESETVTLEDVASLLGQGDDRAAAAEAVFRQAGAWLGYALVALLHTLNPEAVIIGGGVAQVGGVFWDAIREAVQERAMPSVRNIPILPAALGVDAPLVGAAVLARQRVKSSEV